MTPGVAIIAVQSLLLMQAAAFCAVTKPSETCYTAQVLSVRLEHQQALLSVHQSLRAKGHLVYYYPKRIGDRQYLRLRVGIFDDPAQARAYAQKELQQRDGFDYFIARAEVTVVKLANGARVVTTPSGIWLTSEASARELYAPAVGWIDMAHTAPQVSPDGAAVAFYADRQILKVTPGTGKTQVLRHPHADEDLLNSVVRWSSDARYLAYLDAAEWELPTRLWVMRADGTENRCLVADETQQTKVKSFEWHPNRNRLFYVIGPTHGTVSRGGSLCCIDLDGTRRTLVEAELSQGTEVLSEFRIANDLLEYRTVRHHADGREAQYSSHKLPLRDLD